MNAKLNRNLLHGNTNWRVSIKEKDTFKPNMLYTEFEESILYTQYTVQYTCTKLQKCRQIQQHNTVCGALLCRMARGNNQSRGKKSARGKKIARNLARRYPPTPATLWYQIPGHILLIVRLYPPHITILWYQVWDHIHLFTDLWYQAYEYIPSCHYPLRPISPSLSNTFPWALK